MKELNSLLVRVQTELKAPKTQKNSFANYFYRSCEDILEALKPLQEKYNFSVIIADEISQIGDRFYVKATAKFLCEFGEIVTTAYAREPLSKKGSDDAQITGATSSYARKYALNGLFAIDDNKDPDTQDNTQNGGNNNIQNRAQKPKLTAEQMSEIIELINLTNSDEAEILRYFKVANLSEVPYQKTAEILTKKLNAKVA